MSQGLKKATGSGMSKPVLSEAQIALLTEGDVEGLLDFHNAHFGSLVMEDDDEDDEDDKGKPKPKAKVDPKDDRIKELSAEAKKYRLKNRDSRNRIAELERQVAELTRAKKPAAKKTDDTEEQDGPAADPETERKLQDAQRALEDSAIRLEFLSNNKYAWKNPKAALRLLDLRDVEIDEDGDVLGLDEAIEQLARDEPYLLQEAEQPKDKPKKRRQPTGQPTGQQRKGNPNRDKLLNKYPALRR